MLFKNSEIDLITKNRIWSWSAKHYLRGILEHRVLVHMEQTLEVYWVGEAGYCTMYNGIYLPSNLPNQTLVHLSIIPNTSEISLKQPS